MTSTLLRRWWWLPAGIAVGLTLAAAIDSTIVWLVAVVYLPLNLAGTGMLLRELHDQAPGPGAHPERWILFVQLAFVLQLPIGAVVVAVGGT